MEDLTPKSVVLGCVFILVAVIVVIGGASALFGIHVIQPGQAAIVTKFGHLDDNARYEGTYVEPLANFNVYDLKVLTSQNTESAGTANLQSIAVDLTTAFKFQGDKLFDTFKTVGTEDDFRTKILGPNIEAATKASTVEYTADDILVKREELTKKIEDRLAPVLAKYNVDLQSVAITNINFTDADFNKSIEQKQIAEQAAEKAKYDLQTAQLQAQQQAVLTQSLTPAILQSKWIDKWNGVLPTTMSGDASNLLIGVK